MPASALGAVQETASRSSLASLGLDENHHTPALAVRASLVLRTFEERWAAVLGGCAASARRPETRENESREGREGCGVR